MNTVLVIGAGKGQVPLINLIHQYGYKVSVVSPKGDYPGLDLADDVLFADVREIEPIVEYAQKINACAVLTDQLDVGVLTVAEVAERLGLKGIGVDVAIKFTNKYVMREEAKRFGINVPYAVKASCLEDAARNCRLLKFPIMLKPVDSDASRGVYKIYNFKELEEKFYDSQYYSKTKEVILEEFITGKEYVVEAFTRDFETTNLVVGHRDYFALKDNFIPKATVFLDAQSANSDLENRLKEINKKIVKAFGLPFGITHAEYLYNEDEDKIYLVEIAARGGGVFISSDLVPLATGIDINDLLVQEVLGQANTPKISLNQGASAYFCFLLPKGIVESVDGAGEIEKIKGVHKAILDDIKSGLFIKEIINKSSRKGPILVSGKTKQDCYNVFNQVKSILKIKMLNEKKETSIIW